MPEAAGRASWLERAGRVAFMFILMNVWAVAGTVAALTRRKVWR